MGEAEACGHVTLTALNLPTPLAEELEATGHDSKF